MIPMAGLFLPETLHRVDGSIPRLLEGEAAKANQLTKMGRPKQEPQQSEDQTSTTSSRDTFENGPNILSSLTTAFNFADFVATSNRASSETISFANLIQAVRRDLTETSRLYLSPAVSNFLDAWPDKRAWIESTLLDVRRALNDIGMDMDAAQQDISESNAMTSRRKFDWAITHQRRLSRKQQQLHVCHHNLAGAMHVMQTVELCGLSGSILQDPVFEAPARPWVPTDERNASRGPYSRQKYRVSQTNLSMSSVNLSEGEKDAADSSSIQSTLVELPGCMPTNTVQPEDWSLRISSNLPSPRLTTLRRSRALSSHVRPFKPLDEETKSHLDIATELSTRTTSPIQRNESTTSTLASITTPMIARRYRAHAVDVQPQREKHRSLPSELPQLRHQSSLMNDLVDYVLPSAASEKLPHSEWKSSPVVTSPTIPMTTYPDIPEKEPISTPPVADDAMESEYRLKLANKLGNNSKDTSLVIHRNKAPSTGTGTSREPFLQQTFPPIQDLDLRSSQSLIGRKPLPVTIRVDRSMSLPTIQACIPTHSNEPNDVSSVSDDDVILSVLQQRLLKQQYIKQLSEASEDGTTTPTPTPRPDPLTKVGASIPVGTVGAAEVLVNDVFPPDTSPNASITPEEKVSSLEVVLEASSQSFTASASPSDSINSMSSSKPISAQAKRRAAHARRMQIAFGKS